MSAQEFPGLVEMEVSRFKERCRSIEQAAREGSCNKIRIKSLRKAGRISRFGSPSAAIDSQICQFFLHRERHGHFSYVLGATNASYAF
jgi:hypothetical protein